MFCNVLVRKPYFIKSREEIILDQHIIDIRPTEQDSVSNQLILHRIPWLLSEIS